MPDQVPGNPSSVFEAAERRSILVVRAASVLFGVPAESAEEVLDWSLPTPLPRMPEYVPGVIFERGQAIALLNLADFLQLDDTPRRVPESAEPASSRRIVVATAAGMRVGLVCQQVRGVVEQRYDKLEPPEALGGRSREFAEAQFNHDLGLVALLNLADLFKAARPGGSRE